MYILNVFFLFYSRSVCYFGWPHSNFIAKNADNGDNLSRKFENNSCRNLDANESSESPDNKVIVPHLEEVNLALIVFPRVVAPHWSYQQRGGHHEGRRR